ncbi:MAG: NAD(P)/FAD-dependent oxidoreductase [Nitrospirae bacterium]|nr:NAD(P)/FAD-dependent oxidoreductase [Nitrospirota bacterium]
MDKVNITIIGAGVVGLAIAAELSRQYTDIVVLEQHGQFGQEISSRNSEVIHSGIYYPPHFLKTKLCVEGRNLLYEFCDKFAVPYSKIGKLIVASEQSEIDHLYELYQKGLQNGVTGLTLIEKKEINTMEPSLNALSAIHSSETGIIDSHSLMKRLHDDATSNGVLFSFNSKVNFIQKERKGFVIGIEDDDFKVMSAMVINSAGLASDRVAALSGIDIDTNGYRIEYCKGSYFSYSKPSPVRRLVYPLPNSNLSGLGVHATLDLSGRLRFGPDAEYIDSIDYKVKQDKRDVFYQSAAKIINGLDKNAFIPDMAGIRPKIKGDGLNDFIIKHEIDKGLEGLISLVGIESPGLTACLSIAKHVHNTVERFLN